MRNGCVAVLLTLAGLAFPTTARGQQPDIERDQALALELVGRGQADSALVVFHRLLTARRELGDQAGVAWTLRWIGSIHGRLGQQDSALAYHGRDLAISREIGDRAREGASLNDLATVHQRAGQLDSALVYYGAALEVMRDLRDGAREAQVLHNMASLHSAMGRPAAALALYRDVLTIRREQGDRQGEATTLNNIGTVQWALGRPDSAMVYLRRTLPIRREVGDRVGEAATLHNLASIVRLDDPAAAAAYFVEALALKREIGDRAGVGTTLSAIGGLLYDVGIMDSAVAYYRRGLEVHREVDDAVAENVVLQNLGYMHHTEPEVRDLPRALAYYDSAAAVAAGLAQRAGADADRVSFAEQDVDLFGLWPLAWLASDADDTGMTAFAALAAVERGRAQALLELMRRSAGQNAVPTSAGADIAAEGRALVRAAITGSTAILSYSMARDTLLIFLAGAASDIHVHRTPVTADALAEVVARFRSALSVDSAAARSLVAGREAAALESSGMRGFGITVGDGDWEDAGRSLAELILPPELLARVADGAELVVLPHASLNLIPFAALPLPSGEPLSARFALRYAPSLAALADAEARAAERVSGGAAFGNARVREARRAEALVVGNPAMPRVQMDAATEVQLSALPGAEVEGEWVARKLGTHALAGGSASEAAVRERLPSATLVHLATHGFAWSSEERTRDSFIALAPGSGHDGLLTMGEVLDEVPQLSADLVVLSACQTGLGEVRHAEGTVGLQRAFLAKGARSVLVSLWSVSDEATAQLMTAFYTHWLEDPDEPGKAEALQRAQADVRGEPGSAFHHPAYWAAFQLVGAR